MSLSTTARMAIAWTSLSRIGIQALQLLTFVIAARWLSPAEYGTFAIVALVTTFVTLLNDFGLQAALVHQEDPSARRYSTAFCINIAVGVCFSSLIAAIAYPAQLILGYPDLAVALVICGTAFAVSLTVVPSALLQRRLQLGRLAAIEFSANAAGAVTSILLAARGFGVISLSVGPVVTAVAMTISLTIVTKFIPTAKPTVADAQSLWGFSGYLLGVNSTYYVFRNIDIIALTLVSGPAQVGLYSRAYSLVSAPVTQAGAVIGRVLFPILARTRNDPTAFRDRWLRTSYASFSLFLPIAIAVGVTSPTLVGSLFTEQWWPMATVMTALSVAVPMRLLCNTLGPVFQATGHTRALFLTTLGQGAATIVGVTVGTHWGPVGVAWGVAIATNVAAFLPLSVGLRYMEMSILGLLSKLKCVFVAGSVQLAVMTSITLSGGLGSTGLSLVICVTVGLVAYVVVNVALDRDFFGRLVGRS